MRSTCMKCKGKQGKTKDNQEYDRQVYLKAFPGKQMTDVRAQCVHGS